MKCKNCKEKNAVKYSKYTSGKFCSKECARAYSTKNKRSEINKKVSEKLSGKSVDKKCVFCKVDFTVKWNKKEQKTCSRSCASKLKNQDPVFKENLRRHGRINGLKSKQGKRSRNEIHFANLCKERFNKVLTNKSIFNGWDADVIIEDIKLAVLWNGKWHYEKITESHSLKQVQNRDNIKLKEIKNAGYTSYVIKDMGREDVDFVKKEFDRFLKYIAGMKAGGDASEVS